MNQLIFKSVSWHFKKKKESVYYFQKNVKNRIISTVQGTATLRYPVPVPYTGRRKNKNDCAETKLSYRSES